MSGKNKDGLKKKFRIDSAKSGMTKLTKLKKMSVIVLMKSQMPLITLSKTLKMI